MKENNCVEVWGEEKPLQFSQFDSKHRLYHAVAIWRKGDNSYKPTKINAAPSEREDAQHYVDSIRRLMREGRGDFHAITDICLQPVNIPLTATAKDRGGNWNAFSGFQNSQRKFDSWFLGHYDLLVQDAEFFSPEESLITDLCRAQNEFEQRTAPATVDPWERIAHGCFAPRYAAGVYQQMQGGAA